MSNTLFAICLAVALAVGGVVGWYLKPDVIKTRTVTVNNPVPGPARTEFIERQTPGPVRFVYVTAGVSTSHDSTQHDDTLLAADYERLLTEYDALVSTHESLARATITRDSLGEGWTARAVAYVAKRMIDLRVDVAPCPESPEKEKPWYETLLDYTLACGIAAVIGAAGYALLSSTVSNR